MKFGYSSERMLFSFFLGVSLVGLFYIHIITQDLEERSVYTGTENGGLYQGSFSADDDSVYLVYIEPEISCESQFSSVSINDVILFPDCDQTLDEDGWQYYANFVVTSDGVVNVTSNKEIIIVDDTEYQTWALMMDYMVAILLFFGSIFAILMPPLYSFISVFSKLSPFLFAKFKRTNIGGPLIKILSPVAIPIVRIVLFPFRLLKKEILFWSKYLDSELANSTNNSFASEPKSSDHDKKGDTPPSISEFDEFDSGKDTVESEIRARSPKPKQPPKRRNDAHQSENDTSDPGGDQRD